MKVSLALASLLMMPLAGIAHAATIYNNAPNFGGGGDCSFNTTCASLAGRGDDFAAQQFTIGSAVTVLSGDYNTELYGAPGTSVNYAFYTSAAGLPGTLIASGSSAITGNVVGSDFIYSEVDYVFNTGAVNLAAGTYFFAIQEVTGNFDDFLVGGADDTGAAETHDGGLTWSPDYEFEGGVSVSLSSTAVSATPEPGAIYLLGSGLAGVAALRRRFVRK